MTDVFISYSRDDRNKVRLIAHGLAAEGFAVWWDPEIRPGKKWNDAIRRALDNAAAVVTVWSPKSSKSDWVVAETQHGHARKAMVPVTIKNCTPPIPYNMIQSADLTRWRGDADDAEWIAVLRQVRALVEAKRRLLAGAPPPGEAYGADGRGLSPTGGEAESAGRYSASATRGRMGPRASRLAMGAIVATAVITGGLWLGQGLLTETGVLTPPRISPPAAEVAAPTPAGTPEVKPAAPPPPPTATEPPAPAPAASAPEAPAPTPARPAADDRAAVDSLDTCAQAFARLCPRAPDNASPVGFRTDAALAAPERRFLTALQFDVASPVGADAAIACKTRLSEATTSLRRASTRSGSVLSQACDGLSWPQASTPPVVTAPTATPQPQRPPGAISTTVLQQLPPAVATATNMRALDDCATRLARLCPAPQPVTGFAADGRLSRQETTLTAAVAPNATTDADRLKSCTAAATSLQQLSPERRAAGSFGQACRTLVQPVALNPAVLKSAQPRITAVAPQQQPAPPR